MCTVENSCRIVRNERLAFHALLRSCYKGSSANVLWLPFLRQCGHDIFQNQGEKGPMVKSCTAMS